MYMYLRLLWYMTLITCCVSLYVLVNLGLFALAYHLWLEIGTGRCAVLGYVLVFCVAAVWWYKKEMQDVE